MTRGKHVPHIRQQRLGVFHRDRADAARPPIFGGRAALGKLGEQSRKLDQILPGLARRIAPEAREALRDVGRVADLAHLSVADDVDADRHLPAHHLGHRVADHRRIGASIHGLAALAREQHFGYGLAARQAADVRGQDPVGAQAHGSACALGAAAAGVNRKS